MTLEYDHHIIIQLCRCNLVFLAPFLGMLHANFNMIQEFVEILIAFQLHFNLLEHFIIKSNEYSDSCIHFVFQTPLAKLCILPLIVFNFPELIRFFLAWTILCAPGFEYHNFHLMIHSLGKTAQLSNYQVDLSMKVVIKSSLLCQIIIAFVG